MHMDREMHEWMHRYVKDERLDGSVEDGWVDGCTGRRNDGRMYKRKGRLINKWVGG